APRSARKTGLPAKAYLPQGAYAANSASVFVMRSFALHLLQGSVGPKISRRVSPAAILSRGAGRRSSDSITLMGLSQNLLFVAAVPGDTEFDHPLGASLMRRLTADLPAAGWQAGEMANWRDIGWSVVCTRGHSRAQIRFAGIGEREWMLQIVPERAPGVL